MRCRDRRDQFFRLLAAASSADGGASGKAILEKARSGEVGKNCCALSESEHGGGEHQHVAARPSAPAQADSSCAAARGRSRVSYRALRHDRAALRKIGSSFSRDRREHTATNHDAINASHNPKIPPRIARSTLRSRRAKAAAVTSVPVSIGTRSMSSNVAARAGPSLLHLYHDNSMR